MIHMQNIRKVYRNSFAQISCMTAVRFDGKVLWQIGKPDPYNDVLAHDTPFQIHDIDGDGKQEVVLVKDFRIQILEGATGKRKHWTWMPKAPTDNRIRPYEMEVGDSIAFFDLAGRGKRHEILVKDRYRTFWVFNNRLEQLWSGQGQLGHYPYPYDFDGDGKEEVVIGYALWDDDGKQLGRGWLGQAREVHAL